MTASHTTIWRRIFIDPQQGILRSGWRVTAFFAILMFLTVALATIAALILTGGDMAQVAATMSGPLGMGIQSALSIAAALIASAVCLRAFDRRPVCWFGYQLHAGWLRDYLTGAGVAAVMITVLVGIEWAAGAVSLDWPDVSARDAIGATVVSLIVFNISAIFEELAFRGYPLQTLLRSLHPAWGVIITSALFGLVHSLNPHASALGIFNTVLAGAWLAVAYLKTRSLWLCTGLHWSWNWTMSAIYGLNVSGLESIVRSSLVESRQIGSPWMTGGNYGPEGGMLATGVVGVGTLLLWRWWTNDRGSQIEPRITSDDSPT
jgi:uncharacterized protein